MENKQMDEREENKRENKKALRVLVIKVLIAGIVGGIGGFFIGLSRDKGILDKASERLVGFLFSYSCELLIATIVITIAVSLFFTVKGKALVKEIKNNHLDDEAYEALERKTEDQLSYSVIISVVGKILSMMFYGIIVLNMRTSIGHGLVEPLVGIGAFLLFFAVNTKLSQIQVDTIKEINPSKKGSVYDGKFLDKWLDSCDELEKMKIYKASYKSYLFTNQTCAVLWVIMCILGLAMDLGVLPIITISVIWMASSLSYMVEAMKLEKGEL